MSESGPVVGGMGGCGGIGTGGGPAGDTCGGKVGGATDVGGLGITVATADEDEEEEEDDEAEEEAEEDGLGAADVGMAPAWHWMTGGCWAWRCCWADESESLSLSRGLGMLGDELRLSWSMSFGSLLPSSFTLRPSELSPSPSHSDGESGRLSSWRRCIRDYSQQLIIHMKHDTLNTFHTPNSFSYQHSFTFTGVCLLQHAFCGQNLPNCFTTNTD